MKEITTRPNGVTARTLELIDLIASKRGGVNVSEICEKLGITKSTAYSMLRTCLESEHIARDPATGNFILGYKFYEYAGKYQSSYAIYGHTDEKCIVMALEYKTSYVMYVVQHDKAVVLYSMGADDQDELSFIATPLWASAPGRVFMSDLPEDSVDEILAKERKPLTESTITDEKTLREIIARTKKQGYCVDHGEAAGNGLICIAAPVRNHLGKITVVISYMMREKKWRRIGEEFTEKLLKLSADFSRDMGYKVGLFR